MKLQYRSEESKKEEKEYVKQVVGEEQYLRDKLTYF